MRERDVGLQVGTLTEQQGASVHSITEGAASAHVDAPPPAIEQATTQGAAMNNIEDIAQGRGFVRNANDPIIVWAEEIKAGDVLRGGYRDGMVVVGVKVGRKYATITIRIPSGTTTIRPERKSLFSVTREATR
jgi:hypothetical protein